MKNKPNLKPGKRIIMCIGAHPDDCEFRCGGTISLFSEFGDQIYIVSITDGSAGTYEVDRPAIKARRRKESIAASSVIGATSINLGAVDGELEPNLEMRLKLIRLIREIQPDVIITNRLNDYHPDHRYASQLVQDASYMLQVPNVASDTPVLRYVPVIMYWGDSFVHPYLFTPRIIIDIDRVVETKVRMLTCHQSQMFEWLPWIDGEVDLVPPVDDAEGRFDWTMKLYKKRAVPTYADRFRSLLEKRYGAKASSIVEAEAYEICEYGYKLSEEELQLLFSGV